MADYAVGPVGLRLSSMQLSEEDIKEFQEIWRTEFGEDITAAYARERATELLRLLALLLGAPPGEM